MDMFTKNRFTFWMILILLLCNIAAVIMILTDKKGPRSGPPRRDRSGHNERTLGLLQQELGFTDQQIEQYDLLRQAHAQQTESIIHELQQLKKSMMDEILTGNPDFDRVQQTSKRIGELQAEVEEITFVHFLDLKELCGEEQVQQLKELIATFHRKNAMSPQRQGRPPGGPEGEGRPMHPPPRPEHSM